MSNEKRRVDEIIEGLQILSKYDSNGFSVQAEHDELFCNVDNGAPTPAERAKLEELGWDEEDTGQWRKFT